MLLTRSPLGHPPEGGASLDLHVLSTPPAFVLSQDQTLRECIWTAGRGRIVDTESHRLETVSITGSYELGISSLDVPKESFTPGKTGRGRELYGTNFRHAVEFSRSGRTPSRPFRADRGQPELLYLVGSARSNTGSRPDSHLVGALEEIFGPRAWGNVRPAPLPGLPLGFPFLRLRPANKENISRGRSRDANCPPEWLQGPYLLGSSPPGIAAPRSSPRVRVL